MRVAVLDDIHEAYAGTPGIARLRQHAEVEIFTRPFGAPAALRGFDAVIANRERTPFTPALLQALPDLRIIAQTGNHIYHVDLAAARERGIVVARVSSGGCTSAAELAIGLMIAVMRRIPDTDHAVRRNDWPAPMTFAMRGKTLGLIGFGLVGRHVARIASAFDMRVLAWSPSLTPERAGAAHAQACDLDTLMRSSDIVSVHATLTASSRGLIDRSRLALMKPGAYLINTARGPVVDEPALIEALQARRIAGAALDVFDTEPLPADHPLQALPNVVLTPHLGWATDEMYSKFADAAADVLIAHHEGRDVPRWTESH